MKTNDNFFRINHRKKESEIIEHEFYSTHKTSVRTFLDFWTKKYNGCSRYKYWEPAAGSLNISSVLEEYGFEVTSTDLVYRDYCKGGIDFLTSPLIKPDIDCIITNPPFKLATQFIEHAFDILPEYGLLILYLKLTFLEGKSRYNLFKKYQPIDIFIHSSRQGCDPEGKQDFINGGAACYCWMIWQKDDFPKKTTLHWLPPNS